jgi:chemotaxis protein MotB
VRKKRTTAGEENTDRWLVSYADFVTLLFAFFTVMYAISHLDRGKLDMFTGSVKTAFSQNGTAPSGQVIEGIAPVPPDIRDIEKEFSEVTGALGSREEISVRRDARGIVISLGDQLLFDSGGSSVKETAAPVLNALAAVIKKLSNNIIVEGHTDNVPVNALRAKHPSNWELSTSRATNVLSFFLKNHTISPVRFSAAGYAEFKPVAQNETADGRAKNRRVDIVVLFSNP